MPTTLKQQYSMFTPTNCEKNPENCNTCRHCIHTPQHVYCAKVRKQVEKTTRCSRFDPEPLEYKLYIRC